MALCLAFMARLGKSRLSLAGYWLFFILSMVSMILAGHHGASLTHGETYLTDEAPPVVRDWLGLEEAEPSAAELAAIENEKPGKESFANNCLLARRLAENGVRFIQLYHWGWDSHGAGKREALNEGFKDRCKEVDQPMAALIKNLKQRGMLEDTLVVWGGEFGRTPMRENRGGTEMQLIGRDHNPGGFTIWMAGGGVKPGISYGATDPIGYKTVENPVHVRDLHATLLHAMGFDHNRLSYPLQGLNQKLTGVKPARVVRDLFV